MSQTVYQHEVNFELVKGEFYDPIEIQMVDEDNVKVPITDVTSVVFQMYLDKDGRNLALEETGTKDNTNSLLRYILTEADTLNLDAGYYFGRFKIVQNSKTRYAPQAGQFIRMKVIG